MDSNVILNELINYRLNITDITDRCSGFTRNEDFFQSLDLTIHIHIPQHKREMYRIFIKVTVCDCVHINDRQKESYFLNVLC